MKTYKILGLLVMSFFLITSCQEAYLDETLAEVELKSGNAGNEKVTGFDEYGFNWQAQQFVGYGINMILGDPYFSQAPHYRNVSPYKGEGISFWTKLVGKYPYFNFLYLEKLLDVKLTAHWNENLISKQGEYPNPASWYDAEAWVTLRYSMKKGKESWSHFRKLVSVKSSYEKGVGENANKWYDENNNEVGLVSKIFDGLMVIQVENVGDVDTEIFYEEYHSPTANGIGKY